jgi:hypothetical protein
MKNGMGLAACKWIIASLIYLSMSKRRLKMALIVNMAMILIGIFAILMFKYLDENH